MQKDLMLNIIFLGTSVIFGILFMCDLVFQVRCLITWCLMGE